MKAVLSKGPGGPETLVVEEVADPAPKPGQALIAVRACGVNYPDVLIIEDRYQYKPERPFSPGGEIAGVVEVLGEGVEGLKVGDRVLGNPGWGGMAEKVAIDASRLTFLPEAMPFDEAAAFTTTYATGYYGLKVRGRLQPGETLLVLGAAGGVGLAAVELGKAMGARVIAAASSEEKVALAQASGADGGVVYPRGPFDKDGQRVLAALFKDACGEGGADVVYDGVGGDYSEAALRCLAWEGRFLVIGFPAGIARMPLNLALLKGCDIVGVFWGAAAARDPQGQRRWMADLLALYGAGRIRPHVSEHFPLAGAGDAIRRLAGREAMGKIVVMIE